MNEARPMTNGVANNLDDALAYALQLARESLAQTEQKLPVLRAKVAALETMGDLWKDAKQGIMPGKRSAPTPRSTAPGRTGYDIREAKKLVPDIPVSDRVRPEDFRDCEDAREACFAWANLHDGWCIVERMVPTLIASVLYKDAHSTSIGLGWTLKRIVEAGGGEKVAPGAYRLKRLPPDRVGAPDPEMAVA